MRSNLEFELLCGREELSAVRQRARQMVHDKDEELEVCRKLLQKEVEGQKQAPSPHPNPHPNSNPNPTPNPTLAPAPAQAAARTPIPNPQPQPKQAAEAEAAITISDKRAAEAAAEAAAPGLGGADASVVYSARLQSHRDVEVLRLQRECETLQAGRTRGGCLLAACCLVMRGYRTYHLSPPSTDRTCYCCTGEAQRRA